MTNQLDLYILDYPDAMPSAIHGLQDIVTIANHQAKKSLFSIHKLTTSTNTLSSWNRIIFIPPCLTQQLPSFSDPETLALLKSCHQSGAILIAACAGVFWLANTGLLDGKHVTTHWQLCQRLADNYPAIARVSSRDIVIDQGDIVTAAGLYAFQDLALHIIARFHGFTLAKKVADFCLLDLNGRLQAYYQRFYPDFSHGDSLVIEAQQLCAKNLHLNLPISQLADHLHLSERTLLRRFKSTTGYTPKQYIIQLKIEKAKQLFELEKISVEEVGYKIGYTDTSNFIKCFKKIAGVTPAEFRSRQVVQIMH